MAKYKAKKTGGASLIRMAMADMPKWKAGKGRGWSPMRALWGLSTRGKRIKGGK